MSFCFYGLYISLITIYEISIEPWPVWLSWLGIFLQSERSLVQFPVRAWVVGSVPGRGAFERQWVNISSLFLPPLSLKINEKNL